MTKYSKGVIFASLATLLVSCGQIGSSHSSDPSLSSEDGSSSFDELIDGREMVAGQLSTDDGLVVKFGLKGARITTIEWDGKAIAKDGFVVGRVANRIANGTFQLNDQTYNVDKNNGQHHLHGGREGWGELNWILVEQTAAQITYSLHEADGHMGYPGNMDVTVTYTLRNSGELTIEYNAISDADTLINPTNHLYMSLNGNNSPQNHTLWIDADNYTELVSQIPNGQIKPVASTKWDFTTARTMPVSSPNYDDNFVLNGEGYRKVASMTGQTTGINVEVYTDRPGLQLYNTSSHICLETQLYPDAIHQPTFPSPILRANEEFYSKTAYFFTKIAL